MAGFRPDLASIGEEQRSGVKLNVVTERKNSDLPAENVKAEVLMILPLLPVGNSGNQRMKRETVMERFMT